MQTTRPASPLPSYSQLQSATAALRSRLSRTHTTSQLAYSCPPGRRSGTAVPGPGTRPLASQRAARTHSSHAPACTLSVHTQHAHTARLAHTQLIAPYHPHSLTCGATASTIAINVARPPIPTYRPPTPNAPNHTFGPFLSPLHTLIQIYLPLTCSLALPRCSVSLLIAGSCALATHRVVTGSSSPPQSR